VVFDWEPRAPFLPNTTTKTSGNDAGGVLGAAWMTGALACLQDRLPCPAGDVDVIVGTSAGAVLAAALRCHASVEEMMAWQRGQAAGKRVTVLTPGPRDLAAMGINLMDRRRSEAVLDLSLHTSADALRTAQPAR